MVAAVIYKTEKGNIKFLILRRKLHWKGWEFVKGKIEREGLKHAALREVHEETGLRKVSIVFKLPMEIIYHHKSANGHSVSALKACLVECHGGNVRISKEHASYRWVSGKQANNMLTYDTHKTLLKLAAEHITDRKREEKKRLIEKLSKKHVTLFKYDGKYVSLKYDGRRLRCMAVKKPVRDVGDWSRTKNIVYYDRNLPPAGLLPILLHEVVEKHVTQKYNLDVDTEGHKIAQAVEKEWLADKQWAKQAKIVSRTWVKANHRKVGDVEFY